MTVKEAVIKALVNNKRTRNNDTLLCAEVYRSMGYSTDLDDLSKQKNKPSLASIIRWRRKIQEYNPELCAEMVVQKYREKQKVEYLEIARQGASGANING